MRFVLGGSDSEMKHIERLVLAGGFEVVRATKNGVRVGRSYAYEVDFPRPKVGDVWVECSHYLYTKQEMHSLGVDIIDHHYEGDPGFGQPPDKYWEASSVGQVYTKLGVTPTYDAKMIAAGDHCLYAAYHGMCPDLNRDEFIAYRMGFFKEKRTDEQFEKLKNRVISLAKSCKVVTFGNLTLTDITPMLEKYSHWIADVSCMLNMKTITIQPSASKEGWTKYFVSNLSRKEIKYFMDELVYELGDEVIKVYGDPTRQFAGAVVCQYR